MCNNVYKLTYNSIIYQRINRTWARLDTLPPTEVFDKNLITELNKFAQLKK